jgi:hypothetical protein
LSRIILAFRSFFAILFQGALPDEVIRELGLSARTSKPAPAPATPPPPPSTGPSEGALQMLGILQRDARLLDFLMEDISGYSDDQVGAGVRALHQSCRETLTRYLQVAPVIDGVEGTFTKITAVDPNAIKLVGNVPPQPPPGGVLRHRGWKCVKIDLPALGKKSDPKVLAPAEIEIE